ncbi:MAG TPA: C40 family peptidase, partial [Chitinophagales bacterium]|nr:C40 family peptidase [Chitinophagales bacterium]
FGCGLFGCVALLALSSCTAQRPATATGRSDSVKALREAMPVVARREAEFRRGEARGAVSEKESAFKARALRTKYAAKLQTDDAALLGNTALLAFIDEWYNVPYKYGGRDKQGIDCSGLTCAMYSTVYARAVSGTSASLFKESERIKRKDLCEGDLVFFKIHKGRISHVGVYVANGYFLHASTKAGVVLSSLDDPYYKRYYAGGGRLKN